MLMRKMYAVHVWLLAYMVLVADGASVSEDLDVTVAALVDAETQVNRLQALDSVHQRLLEDAEDKLVILEGAGCDDRWLAYRCRHNGILTGKCLASYLVCDGVPDCPAGDDEERCDILSNYVRVGMKFGMVTIMDTCSAIRMAETCPLNICTIDDINEDVILKRTKMQVSCIFQYKDGFSALWRFLGTWLPAANAINWAEETGSSAATYWIFNPISTNIVVETYRSLTNELCSYWVHYPLQ